MIRFAQTRPTSGPRESLVLSQEMRPISPRNGTKGRGAWQGECQALQVRAARHGAQRLVGHRQSVGPFHDLDPWLRVGIAVVIGGAATSETIPYSAP